jgi:hypothetical protein
MKSLSTATTWSSSVRGAPDYVPFGNDIVGLEHGMCHEGLPDVRPHHCRVTRHGSRTRQYGRQ